ncbi:MAG: FIST C-terminal domain-containing protein [Desulfobacter sp.]|nr:MAG: FIST C-terminal domain-containing protein [Desulfobacter sp.]
MEIIVDQGTDFEGLEANAGIMARKGFKTIMLFHAEGGIDKDPAYKKKCDTLLEKLSKQGIQIFGGIFPGIVDDGRLMERGSIMAGLGCHTHVVTLDSLGRQGLETEIEKQLQLQTAPGRPFPFKTVFVFGDGFGESNLNLINALNRLIKKHSFKVVGGLAGRNTLKASHYNLFTPDKAIQNGAVLAFTDLESGIGVKHGWIPLPKSQCTITATNHCYVETLNNKPALAFYLDLISQFDPTIAKEKRRLMSGDSDLIFTEVAIRYPLGLIRRQKDGEQIIDRTPVSVGADRSLQFSAEIPEGTKACILHLKGNSPKAQCLNIREAAQIAYLDSLRLFPVQIPEPRVLVMDCFGRKQMIEQLGQDYVSTEFEIIAGDQKGKAHSPFGVLTFGEISSMEAGYVELHNKTAVVATLEDR